MVSGVIFMIIGSLGPVAAVISYRNAKSREDIIKNYGLVKSGEKYIYGRKH